MSADIEIWKAGACQASVIRRAIVLRSEVSGTRSTSPVRSATAATAGAVAARSTSSATIRPSGPVPRSEARSIPRSRAIRRASGDALTRPSARAGCGASTSARLLGAVRRGRACRARAPRRARARETPPPAAPRRPRLGSASGAETCSPSSPITAIVCPTGTSPSATAIFSRTPEASASTSCVTLSVSSS